MPPEILAMNPGFDRVAKGAKALKNGDGKNGEFSAGGGGSSALGGEGSGESCIQGSNIVYCRDPNLMEEAEVGDGIY
jgi:hypothetical protein